MRLRRAAGHDEEIRDRNNGHNHEDAFVKIIEKKGTLDESLLLQESYAPGVKGKLIPKPSALKGLLGSIPTAIRGIRIGKMRSLPKLIPGVHHKLPGDAQDHVKRIYEHAEEHRDRAQPLHRRRGGRRARARRGGAQPARGLDRTEGERMKLAYWPGCVSRGFTTELHGSMALVAERLGIELVTLDRANCCGAGVIAEHNQELADTLNARTFALAQQTGLAMMNICSTCQGAQSECQQRLDADSAYRAHINEALADEGLEYVKDKDGWENKNFLWVLVEDYGLDAAEGEGHAAALGPARRALLRLLRDPAQAPARLRRAPRARPLPRAGDRGARRRGRRVRRRAQVLRLPGDHDEPRDLAAPGRHPRRRRARPGRRLPGHAVPALPPEPRHAAARGGQGRQPRPRARGPAPAPARRAGARLRAQAARDEPPHRLDRVGRRAARRGRRPDGRAARGRARSRRPRSSRRRCSATSRTRSASISSSPTSTRRPRARSSRSSPTAKARRVAKRRAARPPPRAT